MNRRSTLIVILSVCANLLAGCARPNYADTELKYAKLPSGNGRIYFYQPSDPGSPVTGNPYMLVNGEKAGRTSPGDFFFVDRPAGHYTVRIDYYGAKPLAFDLAAGQIRYVRINKGGSRLTFNEETKEKAQAEMASMSYHGASSRERRALNRAYRGAQAGPAPETAVAPQ
jgi:hypothetical protein